MNMFSKLIQLTIFKGAFFVLFGLILASYSIFALASTETAATQSIFKDSDQDGLSNDEERLYGTNPNESDSDGDGYSDGAEVRSGYNPLKKSPGDKVVSPIIENDSIQDPRSYADVSLDDQSKVNITETVSKEVALTLKESATKQEPLSLDQLKETVQKSMSDKMTVDTLPEIDEKSIKIKTQKYSSLSDKEKQAKIQEDTTEYLSSVSYILVNNSPVPMTSDNDMQQLSSFMLANTMNTLSGNSPDMLADFSQKSKVITEQLREVDVPENMVPLQIKALKLSQYASTFDTSIQNTRGDDPLAQINTFAKAQGFLGLFSDFVSDIRTAMSANIKTVEASPNEASQKNTDEIVGVQDIVSE